ncbi:MAG: hypothetical protein ACI8R9_002156 [Paraglaciecola sp.]|jgi:hypothetical protein
MQSPYKFNIRLPLLCWLLCIALPGIAQEWERAKQQDGVSVFSRPLPNNLLQIKALTTVTANHEAFIRLLGDIEHCTKWIANCKKIEIIATPDQATRLVHTFLSAPWPIRDRDVVTRSVTTKNQDTLEILIEDAGQTYPLAPGHVRMTDVHGQWRLVEIPDGTMTVSYVGSASPAGEIPDWLAKGALIDSIFETFNQLKAVINDPPYTVAPAVTAQ